MSWLPPFYLYHAGRQVVQTRDYYNAVHNRKPPARLLVKHTLAGCGTIYAHGRRFDLPVGHAFVIPTPGPYIYCYEGTGEPWRFEYVSISHRDPENVLPAALCENPVLNVLEHPGLRAELSALVGLRLREEKDTASLEQSALAYRFILNWVSARTAEQNPSPEPARLARQWIDDHEGGNVRITDLAHELGYTPEALTRVFTQAYGLPPGRYAQQVRVCRAARLLERTDRPLKQIAVDCGFCDANHFGRVFRRLTGTTPAQYRRNPDPLRTMLGAG